MIASDKTLRILNPVYPFVERTVVNGMTYGLSSAGYDIRCAETVTLLPGECALASSVEHFTMPEQYSGTVHDKSTWARRFFFVQNTVIEPGWRGYLTLELSNDSSETITVQAGDPIAQVIFHLIDQVPDNLYDGKYQDQQRGPQRAIREQGPK